MSGLFTRCTNWLIKRVARRSPDFVIGGRDRPYLMRWFVIPRNPVFNIYLHKFLRDDDDRALHDHPWAWCSILLRGSYIEHTVRGGGIHVRIERAAPSVRVAGPRRAHRIALLKIADFIATQPDNETPIPCWTLFITGPRVRAWGFHCPEQGWVHWRKFTAPGDSGSVGPGCAGGMS